VRTQTNSLRYVCATFLGFPRAVHYNGGDPSIAKARIFCPSDIECLPFSNHCRRATKQLTAGIIDCAFEIAKKASAGTCASALV
jgi:hypothetical protein